MAGAAARNLEASREYREEVLDSRRRAFYEVVRSATEQWAKRASPSIAADAPPVAAAGAGAARE
jgi:hypothetical protein